MGRCYFCFVVIEDDFVHHNACPNLLPEGNVREEAERAWNSGFREGREKRNCDSDGNIYHRLGHEKGLSEALSVGAKFEKITRLGGVDRRAEVVYEDEENHGYVNLYEIFRASLKNKKPDNDNEGGGTVH